MQLACLDSWMSTGWSWDSCFVLLLVRIILDVTLSCGSASFVALLGFFLKHTFRQQLAKTMLLVPSIIGSELMTGSTLLMTANLKFVQMGQMTFRSDMGKEM
jgi:hypothetical protein